MAVNLKTRVLCNLLLYTVLSYILSLLIGSLPYSLIMHLNVLALHIFICEINGDCKYMKTREYIGHIFAIVALTFGIEAGIVGLFNNELSLLSIASLALIKGGIEYELNDTKI